MKKQRTRRQMAIIRRRIFFSLCAFILALAIALVALIVHIVSNPNGLDNSSDISSSDISSSTITSSDSSSEDSSQTSSDSSTPTSSTTPSSSLPSSSGSSSVIDTSAGAGKPKFDNYDSTATILSIGDIMVHSTQVTGAHRSDGSYDFTDYFKCISPYFSAADLSVANLEITFGGSESGAFSGYPAFNTPDSLADAMKSGGLDLLLTSNNHSYDTGLYGLKRTVKVLEERGLDYIGTRKDTEKSLYTVKTVNNIKIGMANYTYETSGSDSSRKYLNGNAISTEANDLIASFSYDRLNKFYSEARTVIADMKAQGAEYIVFYIHWGNEYQTSINSWQKNIAQQLANLGVDMIIGSHPHVVQPADIIYSDDGTHATVCLYSSGNAVSNQRQELMDSCPSGHTEDGTIFSYTLVKSGDEVALLNVDIIPTWVNKYSGGGGYLYTIYPLEEADWGSTKYNLNSTAAAKASKSFERTKKIVSEGLTKIQTYLGCDITF